MLTPEDLDQIEQLIKKQKPHLTGGAGCVTLLFILFILGIFKGCGY